MTRIRLTLFFLLIGIALPTAFIVHRAVESLAVENAVQHDAVADRIFDEMERSLSDFLLREEARPPSDFEAGADASTNSPGGRLRAAPFQDADEPFIVGWFSLDASRQIRLHATSMGEPRGPGESQREGDARITLALQEGLDSRSATVPKDAALERKDAASAPSAERNRISAPIPGRTTSLSKTGKLRRERADADFAEEGDASTYELLQSLNRAQVLRSERQSKALAKGEAKLADRSREMRSADAMEAPDAMDYVADYAMTDAEPQAMQAELEWAASEMFGAGSSTAPALRPAPPRAGAPSTSSRLAESAPGVDSVDPFTSRATESGDLLLVRSVWRDGNVERQGLVLDRKGLALWLERSVLGDAALADRAILTFGPTATQASAAEHSYLHRFAEPFEALLARLDLEPLPGLGSARPIYMIAGLLGLVTLLGLIAVERMTRVVVDYAQRRGDFVAAVSHELKTPLTSIRMYAEMLRDGLVPSSEKRDEYYATITDESERLSRLIDNVLEFSRLEQNQRAPTLVVGGLAEAVREGAEKLRAHVEREGFTLEVDLETDAPAVQYDRDAVTQLLFNLVDNALKYAKGAEDRRISVVLGSNPDGATELRVRDHGPGVPEDQIQRIFEPFYRVGEELTRSTTGTGIGLALVKELAEAMGAAARGRNLSDGGFEVCIAFSRRPAQSMA